MQKKRIWGAKSPKTNRILVIIEMAITSSIMCMAFMTPFFNSIGLNQQQIALSQMIAEACTGDASLQVPAYTRPLYLHHPLIVDTTGKKLSKREHAHSLRQDKEAGIPPEALFGRVLFKAKLQESDLPTPLEDALGQIIRTL